MASASDTVAAYWSAANERDWEAFAQLLAKDVVYRGPQAREQVRGVSNYVAFNEEGFPGEWHLRVIRVIGEGPHVASWIEMTYADGTTQAGICFFELDGEGKIVEITDFWPESCEIPAQRVHLVERY